MEQKIVERNRSTHSGAQNDLVISLVSPSFEQTPTSNKSVWCLPLHHMQSHLILSPSKWDGLIRVFLWTYPEISMFRFASIIAPPKVDLPMGIDIEKTTSLKFLNQFNPKFKSCIRLSHLQNLYFLS